MRRLMLGILAAGAVVVGQPDPAMADTIFEVENARANARAGGPRSYHDAELLNRYGALSGTPGWRGRYPESDWENGYGRRSSYGHRRNYRRD